MLCSGLNQYVIRPFFCTAVIITHYYRPLHYHIKHCLISLEWRCHESLVIFIFFSLITNCWISEGKATDLINCLTASPHSWLCSKGKPPAAEHAAAAGARDLRARAACGVSTQKTLLASKCKPTHGLRGTHARTQTLTFDILNLHPLSHSNFSGFPTLLSLTGAEKEIRRTWEMSVAVDQIHYLRLQIHTHHDFTHVVLKFLNLYFAAAPPQNERKTSCLLAKAGCWSMVLWWLLSAPLQQSK